MAPITPYLAMALQSTCIAVNDLDVPRARARMAESIARVARQILAAKRFVGRDLRLVVVPEYFLTGFPLAESTGEWAQKAAIDVDGPEYAALGRAAGDSEVFLAGNAYERDANFPGLYFQTSFVIEPEGRVVLRYRRLISLFGPTPYDLWDRYLAVYGRESIFPVADTELGRLSALSSEEILYPDLARAMALRGAEVFVHSSSEVASPLATPKNIAKQARAIENASYVVSANSAGIQGIGIPSASTDASSKIVDFRGMVLAEAGYGESMAAHAEIDVEALRRHRRRPGLGNILSRQPLQLWRDALDGIEAQPRNSLLDAAGAPTTPDRPFYAQRQQGVIDRLRAAGII